LQEALGATSESSSSPTSPSHLPLEVAAIVRRIEMGKRLLLQKEDALGQERGKLNKLQRDFELLEAQASGKDEEMQAGKTEYARVEKELKTVKMELKTVKMENKSLSSLMSTFESGEGANKAPTGEVNTKEGPTVQALRTQMKALEERNEAVWNELEEEREKLGKVR